MTATQAQDFWPCDCHPGAERPLSRQTADLVWRLLLERSDLVASEPALRREPNWSVAVRVADAWARMDDADLWGLLAGVMEAHSEWSEQQREDCLRAWMDVRANGPGHAEWLVYWRRRWRHHHRAVLNEYVGRLGKMTWAQWCRFGEAWTINRQFKPHFCSTADLILELSERLATAHCPAAAGPEDVRAVPRLEGQPVNESGHFNFSPCERPSKHIVVVTPYASIDQFTEYGASRQLLWALENSGLSWSLLQPWSYEEFDPRAARGVIFWNYRHLDRDVLYHSMAIERSCGAHNIPVVNSVISGGDTRHSTILRRFHDAGVPCPRFQKFSNVAEIEMPYPLILRVDGLHRGEQMHLIRDANAAEALVTSTRDEFFALGGLGFGVMPPPNLAIEFVDISDDQGRYHKRRAYVVGDTVVLRHHTVSNHWLVNISFSESFDDSLKANREFLDGEEPHMEELLKAGRASGSEVVALDYSKTPNGGYIVWEANRNFMMKGDNDQVFSEPCSGRSGQRRLGRTQTAKDRRLGEALLTLIRQRFDV